MVAVLGAFPYDEGVVYVIERGVRYLGFAVEDIHNDTAPVNNRNALFCYGLEPVEEGVGADYGAAYGSVCAVGHENQELNVGVRFLEEGHYSFHIPEKSVGACLTAARLNYYVIEVPVGEVSLVVLPVTAAVCGAAAVEKMPETVTAEGPVGDLNLGTVCTAKLVEIALVTGTGGLGQSGLGFFEHGLTVVGIGVAYEDYFLAVEGIVISVGIFFITHIAPVIIVGIDVIVAAVSVVFEAFVALAVVISVDVVATAVGVAFATVVALAVIVGVDVAFAAVGVAFATVVALAVVISVDVVATAVGVAFATVVALAVIVGVDVAARVISTAGAKT